MAKLNVNSDATTINGDLTLVDSIGTLKVNSLLRSIPKNIPSHELCKWISAGKVTNLQAPCTIMPTPTSDITGWNINEFLVIVASSVSGDNYARYPVIIPNSSTVFSSEPNSVTYFKNGSSGGGSYYVEVMVGYSSTSLTLQTFTINGNKTPATVWVFYR